VRVQIIGGPLGTGSAYVQSGSDDQAVLLDEDIGKQEMLGYKMGTMSSKLSRLRNRVSWRERLFERCEFVNGLAEKLGV
jgi:hypothetical protein